MPWDDQSAIYYEMVRRDLAGIASGVVDTRDSLDRAELVRTNAQDSFNTHVVKAHKRGITNSELATLAGVSPPAITKIIKQADKQV